MFAQPPVSFVENPAGQHPQGQSVEHHDQHFGAVEAVGARDACRAFRNPDCEQRQAQGNGVGEHMGGMSQQAQAARKNAADYFNRHVAGHQNQHNQQRALAGAPMVVATVMDGVISRHVALPAQ